MVYICEGAHEAGCLVQVFEFDAVVSVNYGHQVKN